MAKRHAYLHVGTPGVGDLLDTAVQRHRSPLAELDVLVPTKAREESFRAAIELRRRHREWGYRRKEVEGAWAGICRRALRGRSTVLVSQTALAGATPEQIDLLASQLPGLKLHVVLSVAAPAGWSEPGDPERDLTSLLARWSQAVRDPRRLHVVIAPRDVEPAAAGSAVWHAVGEVVGFGTRSLAVDRLQPAPLAPPARPMDAASYDRLRERAEVWREALRTGGYDVRGDLDDLLPAPVAADPDLADVTDRLVRTTTALAEAQREIDRLTHRNETLEARLDEQGRGLRGLRRASAA